MTTRDKPDPFVSLLVVLCAGMAAAAGQAVWNVVLNLRRPAAPEIAARIDPNTASWWELALLPRIGEGTGRQIVRYREESAHANRANDNRRAFRSAADLLSVRGIGPVTLQNAGPYLTFESVSEPSTYLSSR